MKKKDILKHMSKTSEKQDEAGYYLLENEFTSRGYNFKKVEDFKDGWMIYTKTKGIGVHYELIKPHKSEEYSIHGKTVPKKWDYPGDNAFGRRGFDCVSLDRAHVKHEEIVKSTVAETTKIDRKINIPKAKTFTVKDIKKINHDWTTYEVRVKLNSLLDSGKIIWVNKDNYKKPEEKIYKLA